MQHKWNNLLSLNYKVKKFAQLTAPFTAIAMSELSQLKYS